MTAATSGFVDCLPASQLKFIRGRCGIDHVIIFWNVPAGVKTHNRLFRRKITVDPLGNHIFVRNVIVPQIKADIAGSQTSGNFMRSAPTGTDIYATGDGIIKKVGWQTGYGNTIVVDHGYGYQTLYAHLHSSRVKVGQKIVRGQVIGGVGNTGKSTAPHLHYEVLLKGKHVNPVNYYFMDISADDYDRMIQIAANHGKVLD